MGSVSMRAHWVHSFHMHPSCGTKSCFLIIHILNSSSTQGVADVGCLPFVLPQIPPHPHPMAVTSLFTNMAGNISFHSSFWWKVSLQVSPILTASLPFPLHLVGTIIVDSNGGYCNSWFKWWPEQKATRGEGLNFPGFSISSLRLILFHYKLGNKSYEET